MLIFESISQMLEILCRPCFRNDHNCKDVLHWKTEPTSVLYSAGPEPRIPGNVPGFRVFSLQQTLLAASGDARCSANTEKAPGKDVPLGPVRRVDAHIRNIHRYLAGNGSRRHNNMQIDKSTSVLFFSLRAAEKQRQHY